MATSGKKPLPETLTEADFAELKRLPTSTLIMFLTPDTLAASMMNEDGPFAQEYDIDSLDTDEELLERLFEQMHAAIVIEIDRRLPVPP